MGNRDNVRDDIQRAIDFENEHEPATLTDRAKTALILSGVMGLATRTGGNMARKLAKKMGASPERLARANRLNAKHSLVAMGGGAALGAAVPMRRKKDKNRK